MSHFSLSSLLLFLVNNIFSGNTIKTQGGGLSPRQAGKRKRELSIGYRSIWKHSTCVTTSAPLPPFLKWKEGKLSTKQLMSVPTKRSKKFISISPLLVGSTAKWGNSPGGDEYALAPKGEFTRIKE